MDDKPKPNKALVVYSPEENEVRYKCGVKSPYPDYSECVYCKISKEDCCIYQEYKDNYLICKSLIARRNALFRMLEFMGLK